jgi:hypothetical protein
MPVNSRSRRRRDRRDCHSHARDCGGPKRAGGTFLQWVFTQWVFTRPSGGQPPELYVHHWNAHGFNSTAGCKAPKSNNK